MFTLLDRDQKALVVLIWIVLLGNLLWHACQTSDDSSSSATNHSAAQANGKYTTGSAMTKPASRESSANREQNISTAPANESRNPVGSSSVSDSQVKVPFRIEINTAPAVELELLPGIGTALANAIVAWRQNQGLFRCSEDLMLVPGIGPKKYAALKAYIYVESDSVVDSKVRPADSLAGSPTDSSPVLPAAVPDGTNNK